MPRLAFVALAATVAALEACAASDVKKGEAFLRAVCEQAPVLADRASEQAKADIAAGCGAAEALAPAVEGLITKPSAPSP